MKQQILAKVTGVLFVLGVATSVIATALTDPILSEPDYLLTLGLHKTALLSGALLFLLTGLGAVAISLSFYPIIKKDYPSLALASIGFRAIESIFYALSGLGIIALIALSEGNSGTGQEAVGDMINAARNASNFVFGVIAFGLGATAYYIALYRTKLVPRWLTLWGILGMLLITITALYTLYQGDNFELSGSMQILALPIALQELTLAAWLIAKGYNNKLPQ